MAEKMLTNWFTFLLYKFLKVGGPRGAPGGGGRPGVTGGLSAERHQGARASAGPSPARICPLASSLLLLEAVLSSLSRRGPTWVPQLHVTELGRASRLRWGSCSARGPDLRSEGAPGQGRVCVQLLALGQPEEAPGGGGSC